MATLGITKRTVDAAKPASANVFLWDDQLRGFGLKITPTGAKSYIYAYRLGGREAQKKRYTIGRHGSPWTPVTARAKAEQLAQMVGDGIDPALADRERREDAVTLAFPDYAERFIAAYPTLPRKSGRPRNKRWTDYAASILRNKAIPAFKGKTIKDLTKANLSDFLDTLAAWPALRRHASAVLRQLFQWAVERGDIAASPLLGSKLPASVQSRERVLSDQELALAWHAADSLGYPFGPMFQLLIASGQRREEVAALDWRELDRETATWTLPAKRAKNGKAHIVPLSSLAVELLDAIMDADDLEGAQDVTWPRSGYVFTTTGKTAASGHSRAKRRLDAAMVALIAKQAEKLAAEAETVDPWRVHDFRRTLATGLQRLGVRFEVTEAVLNHVGAAKGGVAGVYQRHDWKEEKRTALHAWSDHVAGVLNGVERKNVTDLRSRSAAA